MAVIHVPPFQINSHPLLVHQSSNLERQLWSFVFLSNNKRGDNRLPHHLDFLSVVWKGKTKLSDERDQQCVHLDDPISRKKRSISSVSQYSQVWGLTQTAIRRNSWDLRRRWRYIEGLQFIVKAMDVGVCYAQVAVNPKRRFRLFVRVEPSFRSEVIGVRSPQVFVPVKR